MFYILINKRNKEWASAHLTLLFYYSHLFASWLPATLSTCIVIFIKTKYLCHMDLPISEIIFETVWE